MVDGSPGQESALPDDLTVGGVCSAQFLTAPRRRRVVEVARLMVEHWVSSVIITERGEPGGIVTRHTIIRDVLARGYTGMEVTAGDIAHAPIVTIEADARIEDAAALMARADLRHLAVTREGKLVGHLSDYHLARLIPRVLGGAYPGGR